MHHATITIIRAGAFALALVMPSAASASGADDHVLAFEAAEAARDYHGAMRHAAAGCTERRDFASCRRLASLPAHIGNSGARVPQSLAGRLKEAATVVCRSGKTYWDITGQDVTRRECAHLARRFVLSRDPEYRTALAPEAARFFASIYDPGRAAALTRAASRQTWHATIVSRAELHETLERLEQETGPGTRATVAALTCQDLALPSHPALAKACNPDLVLQQSLAPPSTR